MFLSVGSAAAQANDPTFPQPGRFYLACTVPANSVGREFEMATVAAGQLTSPQLRDPWSFLRSHTTRNKLPRNCRTAPRIQPGATFFDVKCVQNRDGLLVFLREVEQPSGYAFVAVIADVDFIFGAPPVCRRRR